jgi:hypothetical protein
VTAVSRCADRTDPPSDPDRICVSAPAERESLARLEGRNAATEELPLLDNRPA